MRGLIKLSDTHEMYFQSFSLLQKENGLHKSINTKQVFICVRDLLTIRSYNMGSLQGAGFFKEGPFEDIH